MMDKMPYGPSIVGGTLFFKLLDGSTVSCNCIKGEIARKVVAACRGAENAEIWEAAAKRIKDYDERESRGEDVSGEVRPRMPGGSDW